MHAHVSVKGIRPEIEEEASPLHHEMRLSCLAAHSLALQTTAGILDLQVVCIFEDEESLFRPPLSLRCVPINRMP